MDENHICREYPVETNSVLSVNLGQWRGSAVFQRSRVPWRWLEIVRAIFRKTS